MASKKATPSQSWEISCDRCSTRCMGTWNLRTHYRNTHNEDVQNGVHNGYDINEEYWRCSVCLTRVNHAENEWTCQCGYPCEDDRKAIRLQMIAYRDKKLLIRISSEVLDSVLQLIPGKLRSKLQVFLPNHWREDTQQAPVSEGTSLEDADECIRVITDLKQKQPADASRKRKRPSDDAETNEDQQQSLEYEQVLNSENWLIEQPPDSGFWYILSCSKHKIAFSSPSLAPASYHLRRRHGYEKPKTADVIRIFGIRVKDCDSDKAAMHNSTVGLSNTGLRCDYPSCSRSKKLFSGISRLRKHFVNFHLEDLRTRDLTEEWFKTRKFDKDWWRCWHCLKRIYVADDGWMCKACEIRCNKDRKGLRDEARAQDSLPPSPLKEYDTCGSVDDAFDGKQTNTVPSLERPEVQNNGCFNPVQGRIQLPGPEALMRGLHMGQTRGASDMNDTMAYGMDKGFQDATLPSIKQLNLLGLCLDSQVRVSGT